MLLDVRTYRCKPGTIKGHLKLYSEIITKNNINKVERLLVYNLKKNIYGEKRALDNFHINFKIPIISRINRYLACLTIDERSDFFEYIKIPELEIPELDI